MNMPVDVECPMLVPYARYRWDKIREQHQVVYPEGVLVINETSAAILKLCDGRAVDAVIAELSETYRHDAAEISVDVHEFLKRLSDMGLLRDGNEDS